MRFLMPAAVLALAAPLPALAQSADAAPAPEGAETTATARLAETLGDPARQQEMALMLRAMGEVLLDVPVAPLLEGMAAATGEKAPKVAPDATLRSLSPEAASRMPELLEKGVPAAMEGMGAMAGAAERMTPAMKAMAERMAPLLRAMAENLDAARAKAR